MSSNALSVPLRHVITAKVTNEPGVLAQVAGMFAARGFNIDSLVVGRTEDPAISRMTIVVNGDLAVLEQVRKQLSRLVPVVKVSDFDHIAYVERDLVLIQVSTVSGDDPAGKRGQLIELVNLFRAKIIDVGTDNLTIELAGTEDKLEAFIELVSQYGIIELARTGVIAMARGAWNNGKRPSATQYVRQGGASADASTPQVDPASLPPG